MKISTKKLLAKLDNRTTFPLVPLNDKGETDGCQVCGKNYQSEDVMIPWEFGAPVCMNCAHDIVDHVLCAHLKEKALKLKKK